MFVKEIISKKIWDSAPHNAFTDLIRYQNRWICCFREAPEHEHKSLGTICLIESNDGERWNLLTRIQQDGFDLRDPKLSIMPDGSLLLLFTGITYCEDETIRKLYSYTSESTDGKAWSSWTTILPEGSWLWNLTWQGKNGYGLSYQPKQKKGGRIALWQTADGKQYEEIATFSFPTSPSEGTLLFLDNGQALALLRCDKRTEWKAQLGTSSYPYQKWSWKECATHFGSPALLQIPSEKVVACGRLLQVNPYGLFAATALARVDNEIEPFLPLPSSGDCSYPGMVFYDGAIWISYYSSHEEKTSIYFAKVDLLDV